MHELNADTVTNYKYDAVRFLTVVLICWHNRGEPGHFQVPLSTVQQVKATQVLTALKEESKDIQQILKEFIFLLVATNPSNVLSNQFAFPIMTYLAADSLNADGSYDLPKSATAKLARLKYLVRLSVIDKMLAVQAHYGPEDEEETVK